MARYPKDDRRIRPETRVSFAISLVLHLGVILLLGIGAATQVSEDLKLTEIAYLEERYGEEVAKKVTVAPEKLAPAPTETEKPEKIEREGSLFAKAKPERERPQLLGADMASLPLPAPKPKPKDLPNAFEAQPLKSRSRRAADPTLPRVNSEQVLLSAGLTDAPRQLRQTSEEVNLAGDVLVGRTSRLTESQLFEIEAGDSPAMAGSNLTLSVPEGGLATGHPDLVGGSLTEGKKAYQGDLPDGHLVSRGDGQGRVTALAGIQVEGPSGSGSVILGAEAAEPLRGKGLVSRGGTGAVNRGVLKPRGSGEPATQAVTETIKAPEPGRKDSAPAVAELKQEGDGVSMTLSGPILGREILASRPPLYPPEARQRGWQGSVSVYFTVRADGTLSKIFIEKASPYQPLDQAAKQCLADWRFSPIAGNAEQWGVLTIVFRLR